MSELPVSQDDLQALAALLTTEKRRRPVSRVRAVAGGAAGRAAAGAAVRAEPVRGLRGGARRPGVRPGRRTTAAGWTPAWRGPPGRGGRRAVDARAEPAGPHAAAAARLARLHPGPGAGARAARRGADRGAARRREDGPGRAVRPDLRARAAAARRGDQRAARHTARRPAAARRLVGRSRQEPGPGLPHSPTKNAAGSGRRATTSPPTCAGCCRRGGAPPAAT